MVVIPPLAGWALDAVATLDQHDAGFAGRYFRASAEKRQVIAAALAKSSEVIQATGLGDYARFLSGADHKAILFEAYGTVPGGLRGALRRSGFQPHDKRFYPCLHQMLSVPKHRKITEAIAHSESLDLTRLRVIRRLPIELCTGRFAAIINSVAMASDVDALLDLLSANGVDRPSLVTALRAQTTTHGMSDLWKRWTLKTIFAPHPVPAADCYRPISNAYDLRRLALRYRNCAERFISACLDGDNAFAEFLHAGRGLIVHLQRQEGAWQIDELHARDNGRVHPDIAAEAVTHLAQHGVYRKPRARSASRKWEPLRRLTSPFAFDEFQRF